MKIVVAGRFDYIRFAWQKKIDNGQVLYLENGFFRKLSFQNKLKAKWESFLGKIQKKKAADFAKKNSLREYFDIDSLKKQDEILFIIYETNFLSSDFSLLEYLKKSFPKSKFVLQYTNAIGTVRPKITKKLVENSDFFDLVYTFNRPDAEKYGYKLFVDICSGDYSAVQEADCNYYDVFYIGKAKNRLNTILSVANKCLVLGLKIKFFIVDVAEEDQIQLEGVTYNHFLSYTQMLSIEKKSKSILNVMQGVSSGLTLRDEEAICMNKILITDGNFIFNTKYYTKEKVIPLSKLENQIDKIVFSNEAINWNGISDERGVQNFINRITKDLNI